MTLGFGRPAGSSGPRRRLAVRAWLVAGLLAAVSSAARAEGGLQATLTPLTPTQQSVGTTFRFLAGASPSEPVHYRFSVGVGSTWRVVRDFDTRAVLEWTPLDEGVYTVQVTARSGSGATARAERAVTVTSRLTGGASAVAATPHPLVALLSTPPCQPGWMRAAFWPQGGAHVQYTPWKPCGSGRSVNFYVAGMRANTLYNIQTQHATGAQLVRGPMLAFRTGALPPLMPAVALRQPPGPDSSFAQGVLLIGISMSTAPGFPIATDLAGRIVWYYNRGAETLAQLGANHFRPVAGGSMLLSMNDGDRWQVLREIDLAGNTLRETTVARVNEQLSATGRDTITAFHHDAFRLPNGYTAVLASVERVLSDVQGAGPVDILGDMVVVLDQDWQVTWVWDAFDHLDVTRRSTLNERCTGPVDGCRPLREGTIANDWTHSNSVVYSPWDGNLLVSVRNQDWVIKIDYRDGAGTGEVIWRLGPGGDFVMLSADPSPWFTHQHDAKYVGMDRIALFDNGSLRCLYGLVPGCNSRGQVLRIDEAARTATLEVNADLGAFSIMVGSAQALANGNYAFMAGHIYNDALPRADSIEVREDGSVTFVISSSFAYRSFRMKNLYTP